jgi:hypothetical protein
MLKLIEEERIYLENTQGTSFKYYCIDLFVSDEGALDKKYYVCATYDRIRIYQKSEKIAASKTFSEGNLKNSYWSKGNAIDAMNDLQKAKMKGGYGRHAPFQSFGGVLGPVVPGKTKKFPGVGPPIKSGPPPKKNPPPKKKPTKYDSILDELDN